MTSLTKSRIGSIDLLKGLVMVLMALDHTREYFHAPFFYFIDPFDINKTSLPIFFTGWITHYCAPAFSFLAGISACIVAGKKTTSQLSWFLLKRGVWLVFIEITFVSFGWFFDFKFGAVLFAVISTLGISMIVLAALVHLPKSIILIFSCLVIFGHNLLDPVQYDRNMLWAMIHGQGLFKISHHTGLIVAWSVVPWIGVMSLGYCFGGLYNPSFDGKRRKKILTTVGVVAILLFLLLRSLNLYGDPVKWTVYDTAVKTFMSFINVRKYPASLLFLLITLGPSLIFLANTENLKGRIVSFFSTFGRVPFFYYLIHLYLIHFFALIAAKLSGFGWHSMITTDWLFKPKLHGYGFGLVTVYLIWIGIIALVYPLCKKFDNYKMNHREKWWLSYL